MKSAQRQLLEAGSIRVDLLWFDSLGAKSSSVLVETPDLRMLIDPGAAVMQPGYPLPPEEKERLRLEALNRISKAAEKADVVFISHYHYDHHALPSRMPEGLPYIYQDKVIWAKNPNLFINRSQWKRARLFLEELRALAESSPKKELVEKLASPLVPKGGKDRKSRKKRTWVKELIHLWKSGKWAEECEHIRFADGQSFRRGKTSVRFTAPLFHGREYEPVGWVVGMVLEYKKHKFLYSSDIQGPVVEEYAQWVIAENPHIAVIDGPPTYLAGYRVSKQDIERARKNIMKILQSTSTHLIVYDHHLLREGKYRHKFHDVFEAGKGRLLTAAEALGEEPLIDRIKREKNRPETEQKRSCS